MQENSRFEALNSIPESSPYDEQLKFRTTEMKALVSHRNHGRDGLFIELRFGSNRGMNSHWQGSRTTYTKSFI